MEALGWLLIARILLKVLPFLQVKRLMTIALGADAPAGEGREFLRAEIIWAIERAASFLPGKTVCFPRGIAAHGMCRKRGIDTMLYYGAQVSKGRLSAHVWVRDGSQGVVGHHNASEFEVLARYPAGS
jgi:hypothetical protein